MRRTFTILAVLCLATPLAACSDSAREQAAQLRADQLAQALTERKLGNLAVSGGGQEQLDALVGGARSTAAQVAVTEVDVNGQTATAILQWQWATPQRPWTYTTTANMTWQDEQWVTQWAPTLVEPSLVAGESLRIVRSQGERGNITGAGGVALVKARKVMRFGIDKAKVDPADAGSSARALAKLVGIDPDDYAKRVKKAGPKAFVVAVTLRESDAAEIPQSLLASIDGALSVPAKLPLAPTRDFAAAILGWVGEATAQVVADSQGAVKAGDLVGLSGLQARYEEQLAGQPGEVVAAVNGKDSRELFAVAPVDGAPLATTLDPEIQEQADKALAAVKPASALVALRPSTGDILAAAVGPGSKGQNTASAGRYPPGSTMKVVTALALLRAGMTPSDSVDCAQRIVVDGKSFKNYDGYPSSMLGRITLQEAIANSCNTALIAQQNKLGKGDLAQAGAALGMGVDRDLGFPAYFGQVPTPQTQTGKAAALIGQGEVLASPMVMAAVAASVQAGRAVLPRLLPDVHTEPLAPEEPLTGKEARALRQMMLAVVTQGTAQFLADVPGPAIGAKTGTAEFGTEVPLATHTWMIATQGDLAVAAFVEVGDTGSTTVGPILEQFLRAIG